MSEQAAARHGGRFEHRARCKDLRTAAYEQVLAAPGVAGMAAKSRPLSLLSKPFGQRPMEVDAVAGSFWHGVNWRAVCIPGAAPALRTRSSQAPG